MTASTTDSAVPSQAPAIAVVTLASAARRAHVDNQLAVVGRSSGVRRMLVWLGDDSPTGIDADVVLSVPPGPDGLRLAAARNAGADRAVADGAGLVVFLDADCVPDPSLFSAYAAAAAAQPEAVLCGPVTYLPPGVDSLDPAALDRHRSPHAARPAPPRGQVVLAPAHDYRLFWSLSFALTATAWSTGPRFDEKFEGYGGEDTDFAYRLRSAGVPLAWVGGADAYHQHHPTTSPPVAHLDDILRNGALFARTWGEWPMLGWLEAFERDGLVRRDGAGWARR